MTIKAVVYALPWIFICLAVVLHLPAFRTSGIRSSLIAILFLVKMAGAFALQWLYTYYYTDRSTADIYRFFDDGKILHRVFYETPTDYLKILLGAYERFGSFRALYFEQMNAWIKPYDAGFYNDNLVMIKLNSLFCFLSDGHYEVHAILFGTAAFIGIGLLALALIRDRSSQFLAFFLAILFPSSLLLMNGGLKEAMLAFGAGLFVFTGLQLSKRNALKWQTWAIMLVSLWILVSLKPYYLASVAPALLAYHLYHWRPNLIKSTWVGWLGIAAIGGILVTAIGFEWWVYIAQKQNDFINHSLEIDPGSAISITRLASDPFDILLAVPAALLRVLFFPLPWNASGGGEWLMVIENLWLVIAVALIPFRLRNVFPTSFILQAILPGLALIGLISPVLGASMRYRAPFVVMFIIVGAYAYQINRKSQPG